MSLSLKRINPERSMKNIALRQTLIASALSVAALSLGACDQAGADAARYAQVTDVTPITKTIKTPRQDCKDITVVHKQEPKDKNQIAGTVIGAVVGGALGNQVGGGDGKKAATVAGAVAGGYAGKKIEEHQQNNNMVNSTQQRCETVTDSHTKVLGYKVTYTYKGETGHVRMDHKPGDRIQIKDGVVAVNGGS